MNQTRKIARRILIKAISGVGRPAQTPAVVTMLKSRDDGAANMKSILNTKENNVERCQHCGGSGWSANVSKSSDDAAIRKTAMDNSYAKLQQLAEQDRASSRDISKFASERAMARVLRTPEGTRLYGEYQKAARS